MVDALLLEFVESAKLDESQVTDCDNNELWGDEFRCVSLPLSKEVRRLNTRRSLVVLSAMIHQ